MASPLAKLKEHLAHPLVRGLALDDPRTTALRRRVIRAKPFLEQIYREWYEFLLGAVPAGAGQVLELGSGGGFLDELLPGVITSEVFYCPHVRAVLDGQRLPFADASLRAIVMVDVLHHIPDIRRFLAEAGRCVRPGGAMAAIEPWVTPWSRCVYSQLHHEPFQPGAADWAFPSTGPLSGANGALPWIVLKRDRARFTREFPQWRIVRIEPILPLRYLLSGGVSLRSLQPAWAGGFWRGVERVLHPARHALGMFAQLVLQRTP